MARYSMRAVTSINKLFMHVNYTSNKKVLTSLGGQFYFDDACVTVESDHVVRSIWASMHVHYPELSRHDNQVRRAFVLKSFGRYMRLKGRKR